MGSYKKLLVAFWMYLITVFQLSFLRISWAEISSSLTLSGTCISSLSNRYIGAFSNRKSLLGGIVRAGEESGERVWPFPLDDDYEEDLKSDIADILQVICAL